MPATRVVFHDFFDKLIECGALAIAHVEEADAHPLILSCPLRDTGNAKSLTDNLEDHFDTNPWTSEKGPLRTDLAAAKAQVDEATGDRRAVVHQQERCWTIHCVASVFSPVSTGSIRF
jgi:hypothetical protein